MAGEHRGAKVGPRVAMLVSQAIVTTHQKLLHVKHKLAVMIFNTISNEISDEVDTTIGPIIRQLMKDYDQDGPAQAYLKFMGYGRGQLKAISGSNLAAGSLLWSLSTILNNEFAPLVYHTVKEDPHSIPDPASVASMTAIGKLSRSDAIDDIGSNGFPEKYADAWLTMAQTWPGIVDALDLMRRGELSAEGFAEVVQLNGYAPQMIPLLSTLQRSFVSMADAAIAFLRGTITREQLNDFGSKEGYTPADIDVYLDSVGEPPGTEALLEARRRGFIDTATLQRGILQSRTRNEWIPVIEQLAYSPMSVADAVNAAVQNHMTQQEAASIAEQNGLEPGQYDILYQTAGEPLSRTELNNLYNRGQIGSDVVKQGLAESRLKDKYVNDAFNLRRVLLEPRIISESVRQGVMTHQRGVELAMEHGFNAEDAAILVDSGSSQKVEIFKNRIIAAAEALYVDNAISSEDMSTLMQSMGYSKTEAGFATQASEYHREAKVFAAVTNAVRSKYIAHHITEAEASILLDAAGMQAAQRDHLLGMWTVELSANTRTLTPAQIVKAVNMNLISPDDGLARMQFLGYSADDATLLLGGA